MPALAQRRRDPDQDRARRIADEYHQKCLENFRKAMKNTGKSPEEIERWCNELEERSTRRKR